MWEGAGDGHRRLRPTKHTHRAAMLTLSGGIAPGNLAGGKVDPTVFP